MLRLMSSRCLLLTRVAAFSTVVSCGGRFDASGASAASGAGDRASGLPPSSKLSGEKSAAPLPPKASTAGRVDYLFGGTGSSVLPGVGQLPVCLLTGPTGEIWIAARAMDEATEAPRVLAQLDARGSLDQRASSIPGTPNGILAALVGLEACARTTDGDLVVVHRGGRLGAEEVPVGPGLAYASRLVATSPDVVFETVPVPFAASVVDTETDGTYVLAADRVAAPFDVDIARVRRDGTWLGSVKAPPMPGFRVRRLVRDGDVMLLAGTASGKSTSPSAVVGRLRGGTLAWAATRVASDLSTSAAPRDRFGLSVDDQGHAYVAVGPGLTVGRFVDGGAAIDRSFGKGGQVQIARDGIVWDAVAAAGGRLVVATSSGLVRVDDTGDLDATYGEGGSAPIHLATSQPLRVAATPDGAVLLAGLGAAGAIEVTRFTP
jgi:hypothetical protein